MDELKNKGNELFKAKKYKEAISYYTKAIETKDDVAALYSNRALCYLNLGLYFHAKEDCDKAIEADPTFVKAYYRRALAQKELSRYNKALEDFEKVLSLDSNSSQSKREAELIQKLLRDNNRLDLKLIEKPENAKSKIAIKTFDLRNKYTGEKSYR